MGFTEEMLPKTGRVLVKDLFKKGRGRNTA